MEIRISELGLVTTLQNADFLATVQDGVTSKITGNEVAFSVKSIANLADVVYVDTSIATAIANLIDGAPQMLDTLRELADAMNNNPEFYNELQSAINNSVQESEFQEYFDNAFAGKNTYHLVEGSNLYYTPQRVLDLLAPQITTELLNVKDIVFTGTGIVDINSGNDLQLNAAGEIFINGKTTEQRVLDVVVPLIPTSIFDLGVPEVSTPENIPGYLYYNGTDLSWKAPPPPNRLVNGAYQVVLGDDGTVSLSSGSNIYDDGGALRFDANKNIQLSAYESGAPATWTFGTDGRLALPAGGDIVDSTGASVLFVALDLFSGSYADLTNKPTLFSGSYNDLTNKPTAPTFTSVTATDLNVENITFTGAGPVSFTSGNDLAFVASGNITFNGNELATVATSGSYNDLTNKPTIVEKTTGSWTLAAGANTVSLTVPINGTYSIWVNGNIPNGIVSYTATVVVTNTNVPVLGSSYGWYYVDGNALVLTAIPDQVVGTANGISTAVVATTTANVFTFGITNNSGSDQVVNWGYTKL